MRNPAPLVLSLALAAAAVFLMVRKPDPAPSPSEESPTAEAAVAEAPAAADPADRIPSPWPQSVSDIPADSDIQFGTLENGMRFIILPNDEPPKRLSVRLHIAAGSLMEADDQQGLAHFLEHMVFNGTKHFTPAELIPRMQRLGIAFGAHANAYTSFDETVYMLDLPDLSEPTLDLAFTVMRDFADGALLSQEEIDKERGVILSEMNSRDSIGYRIMKKQFQALLPDSLITRRFPIGQADVIENAQRDRFVDFYHRYYTPSRMTFVVVGDLSTDDVRQRIEKSFGNFAEPENPGGNPDLGKVETTPSTEPLVFSDAELPATSLSMMWIKPFEDRIDNRENRAEAMRLALANAMIGRRFDRLSKESDAAILEGSASSQDLFRAVTIGSVDVTVTEGRLDDAVTILEHEYRRALEHGFTEAELAEAKANVLNYYEQQVANRESRRSDSLATWIARTINERSVLSSPETDLEVAKSILEEVTPKDCHAAFLEFWKDSQPRLVMTAKEAPEDIAQQLSTRFAEAATQPVEAPEEAEVKTFAYTDFGPSGMVADRSTAEDLGITRLTLSNGITVNLKPTDFDKNRISLLARIGHGRLGMDPGKPGLAEFTDAVVNEGGIGEHSAEELRRILAGRNVGSGFGVGEDSFALSGTTTPDDLALQLQLMTAQLLHPGTRQEAIDQFRRSVPMIYQQLRHNAGGAQQKMSAWLRNDDPRFSFPEEPDTLLAYTADDILPWLAEDFTSAAIELNVVGDFDPETLEPLILSTFGALPQRPAATELPEAQRTVTFPKAPQEKEFTYQSRIERGQSMVIWKVPGPRGNEEQFRRFNLVADILADRLREEIREKLGASYSPSAQAAGSLGLDDFGFLLTASIGKPNDIPTLNEASRRIAADLAENGADEDELTRARTPMLAELEKSLRDNGYWLGTVLNGSTQDPRRFDLARHRIEDVRSITLDEINALAKKYLNSESALSVSILPVP
ncbi:zinc protease [Haloferula luteola]|uniref:Zinc protease n=1 Tax=Haloferula luteola TaxID=595692 RepID=A0A840V2L0_9BACT|nr:M16 family metallopeptidase [Haloferula luteola]MBB5352225.1 zinc protease [Haloferula luteola]